MNKISALIILACMGTFLQAQELNIQALMPKNNACGSWLTLGKQEYYQSDELFFLINGGADLYLEYGFKEVLAQNYQNNTNDIIGVEIYDMGSSESAFGIYSMSKTSDGEPYNLGDFAILSDHALSLCKSKYFILLRAANANPDIRDGFCMLAEQILRQIPENGQVPTLINQLNLSPEQTLLLKGPIGLSTVYYFDSKNIFAIETALALKKQDTSFLYFAYRSKAKADSVYYFLQNFLPEKSKFTGFETFENSFALSDKKAHKLSFVATENIILVRIYESKPK